MILLLLAPAFACGCSEGVLEKDVEGEHAQENTEISISGICSTSKGRFLDILIFEDDRLRRLDSYQRIENFDGNLANAVSTSGEKIFFLCENSQRNKYDWADISSYSALQEVHCNIEKESIEHPTLTGECRTIAGDTDGKALLSPLSSIVQIKSVCSDFSGTPYAEMTIKDARIYLININASCPLSYTDQTKPSRYINTGCYNNSDVSKFKDRSLIVKDFEEDIGRTTLWTDINLICYPNPSPADNLGSPATRLVLEGKIDSQTYYWPINVGGKEGVQRGCRYVYELFIRRKGGTDPDIPFEIEDIDVNMTVKPWKEKEDYQVRF